MATLDRIRLTGLLRRKPWKRGFFYWPRFAGDDEAADEATVKTFYRDGDRVRLQPENDALEPIFPSHVRILGRVTGVFRTL